MELRQINDAAVFHQAVRRFQAQCPTGSVADNCYLLPHKVAALVAQGRLYQMALQGGQALAFLVDEGPFYRVHLFVPQQEPHHLGRMWADKPLLAEVVYQDGRMAPRSALLMQALEAGGFQLHQVNRQFRLPIPPLSALQPKLDALHRQSIQEGFTLTSAQAEDFGQICALWKAYLDPYAFSYATPQQWQEELQAGRLQCIKDGTGAVVAAQQFSLEGKTSQESHLVVAPPFRGRGLARVMYHRWLSSAAQAGCVNAFCWIARDNAPSLAFHRDFIPSNKLSAQYVRTF